MNRVFRFHLSVIFTVCLTGLAIGDQQKENPMPSITKEVLKSSECTLKMDSTDGNGKASQRKISADMVSKNGIISIKLGNNKYFNVLIGDRFVQVWHKALEENSEFYTVGKANSLVEVVLAVTKKELSSEHSEWLIKQPGLYVGFGKNYLEVVSALSSHAVAPSSFDGSVKASLIYENNYYELSCIGLKLKQQIEKERQDQEKKDKE